MWGLLGKMNGFKCIVSSCLQGLRLDLREQKRKSAFISAQVWADCKERNGRAAGGKGGLCSY